MSIAPETSKQNAPTNQLDKSGAEPAKTPAKTEPEPAKVDPVKKEEKKTPAKVEKKTKEAEVEPNDELTPIEKPDQDDGEDEDEDEDIRSEDEKGAEKAKSNPQLKAMLTDLQKRAGEFAESVKDLPEERQMSILYAYVNGNLKGNMPKGNNPIGNPVAPPKAKTLVEINESTNFLNKLMAKTGMGRSVTELLEGGK